MATNPLLRFRRSAAQLHALAEVERTIRATDSKCRRKYLRDFNDAFQTYRRVLATSDIDQMLSSAETILVGDYHALPASQRFTAQLVEKLVTTGKEVVLGVEAIVASDQHILDEWQRREIDSDELRSRIRFETDWGYDWQPFRELMERARAAGVKVFGLDCTPRQDMRSIRARDRHAAAKISEIRKTHPNAVTVVLFGESHLAPNHLPKLIRELRPRDQMLTVLQNVDALYWLSAGEPQDLVEAVEVNHGVVCVFSATPLEKYEHYRLCIERWKLERAGKLDLAPSFYNLIGTLFRFLNLNLYAARGDRAPSFLVDELPEVWCVKGEEQLERLLYRRMSTRVQEVTTAIRELGSYYVPERNVIVAHEFRMPWAAEQASRFVFSACRGGIPKLTGEEDRFYAGVIEVALGYFGSKVLCPSRKLYTEASVYSEYLKSDAETEQAGLSRQAFHSLLDWVLVHKHYEKNRAEFRRVAKTMSAQERWGESHRAAAATMLGQLLGSELYMAYLRGTVGKRLLRKVYFKDLSKPGSAKSLYLQTTERLVPTRASRQQQMVS
ncbi:MAG TPA: ChaN family lipoprotein [Terriglobales bacterium]|nr:ChaN family lipoprotein [Terriglobales bacterium]